MKVLLSLILLSTSVSSFAGESLLTTLGKLMKETSVQSLLAEEMISRKKEVKELDEKIDTLRGAIGKKFKQIKKIRSNTNLPKNPAALERVLKRMRRQIAAIQDEISDLKIEVIKLEQERDKKENIVVKAFSPLVFDEIKDLNSASLMDVWAQVDDLKRDMINKCGVDRSLLVVRLNQGSVDKRFFKNRGDNREVLEIIGSKLPTKVHDFGLRHSPCNKVIDLYLAADQAFRKAKMAKKQNDRKKISDSSRFSIKKFFGIKSNKVKKGSVSAE